MHEAQQPDPMQSVFEGAEAIAEALDNQAGCEMALFQALEPILAQDRRAARVVYAVLESMALFRDRADAEARKVLKVSIGHA